MTNYVRTLGQQIVNNTVRRAIGNLKGGITSSSSSDFTKLNRSSVNSISNAAGHGNGESYQTMSFPLDVLSDPNMGNHGHYIQFFVNVQKDAKIKFHTPKSGAENLSKTGKIMHLDKAGQVLSDAARTGSAYVASTEDYLSSKIASNILNGSNFAEIL